MTTPQPGWYDDPQDPNLQRYWDGQDWTPHQQQKSMPEPTPSPGISAQPPPPGMPPQPPPSSMPPQSGYPTGSPAGSPPPAWPAPSPGTQAGAGQTPAVSFATVQGAVKQLGATAWLLIGGFVAAIISIFLTWETVTQSLSVLGTPVYSETGSRGTSSGGKFFLLLPIVVAAWLAWPVFAGMTMSARRLLGLSAVVGLMVLSIPLWFVVFRDNDPANGVQSSYGFGLFLFSAAVLVIAAGVVRIWMYRSKAQRPAS